jgi:hypothetical protein
MPPPIPNNNQLKISFFIALLLVLLLDSFFARSVPPTGPTHRDRQLVAMTSYRKQKLLQTSRHFSLKAFVETCDRAGGAVRRVVSDDI